MDVHTNTMALFAKRNVVYTVSLEKTVLPEDVVMMKLETVSMVVCLVGMADHVKMNAVNSAMKPFVTDKPELVRLDAMKVT